MMSCAHRRRLHAANPPEVADAPRRGTRAATRETGEGLTSRSVRIAEEGWEG